MASKYIVRWHDHSPKRPGQASVGANGAKVYEAKFMLRDDKLPAMQAGEILKAIGVQAQDIEVCIPATV